MNDSRCVLVSTIDRERCSLHTNHVGPCAFSGVPVQSSTTRIESPKPKADMVNHPPHYTNHPSGIECIEITRHMGFTLGNALKYIWRADLRGDAIEDLKKAIWYINDELARREEAAGQ